MGLGLGTLVGGSVAGTPSVVAELVLVLVVVGAKIVLVVVVVTAGASLGCGVGTPVPMGAGAGVVPVFSDKKMDRTFLKLAALSLSPSTAPVLHGCMTKAMVHEIKMR